MNKDNKNEIIQFRFSSHITGATIQGSVLTSYQEGNGITTINGGIFESKGSNYTTTIKNGAIDTEYIKAGTVSILANTLKIGNNVTMDGSLLIVPQVNCGSLYVNGSSALTVNNRSSYIHTLYDSNYGIEQVTANGNNFRPHSSKGDNTVSCGSPSYRWTQVYAATATISTSDGELKDTLGSITDAEKRVAQKIKSLIIKFKFKDAVKQKGNDARIHYGVVAQDLKAAFESEGLNPYEYAMFCSDTWYEVDSKACDQDERPYTVDHEGAIEVTQLGIRYEELLCLMIASI
jgi:hypothetical protein